MSTFALIENRGPNNLASFLRTNLRRATGADLAVSFISQRGLSKIFSRLRRVAARGAVRVLTGLYQDITEPTALRTLLRVQRESLGRLAVRLSPNLRFHRKLYLIKDRLALKAIVGSSNLTREGLTSSGELGLAMTIPTDSPLARKLCVGFDDHWNRAVSLQEPQIRLYEKRYRVAHKPQISTGLPSQRKILGRKEPKPSQPEPPADRRFWRESCLYYAGKETQQKVEEETEWDEYGYDWHGVSAHQMRSGHCLLVLDFIDRSARLVKIVDTAEINTPEGRYFIAYKPIRAYRRRRFTKALWQDLRSLGVVTSQADARNRRRSISPEKWEDLEEMFRRT